MEEEMADLRGQMQRFGEEKEKWKKEREVMNLKDKEQYKSLQQFDEVIKKMKKEEEEKNHKIIQQRQ